MKGYLSADYIQSVLNAYWIVLTMLELSNVRYFGAEALAKAVNEHSRQLDNCIWRYRLVVRTSRCGRENLGSNPSTVMFLQILS